MLLKDPTAPIASRRKALVQVPQQQIVVPAGVQPAHLEYANKLVTNFLQITSQAEELKLLDFYLKYEVFCQGAYSIEDIRSIYGALYQGWLTFPSNAYAWGNVGWFHMAYKNLEKAQLHLEAAIRMQRNNPLFMQMLGQLFLTRHDLPGNSSMQKQQHARKAYECFTIVVEQMSACAPAYLGRAQAAIHLQRYEEAANDVLRVLQAIPNDLQALNLAYELEKIFKHRTHFAQVCVDPEWAPRQIAGTITAG